MLSLIEACMGWCACHPQLPLVLTFSGQWAWPRREDPVATLWFLSHRTNKRKRRVWIPYTTNRLTTLRCTYGHWATTVGAKAAIYPSLKMPYVARGHHRHHVGGLAHNPGRISAIMAEPSITRDLFECDTTLASTPSPAAPIPVLAVVDSVVWGARPLLSSPFVLWLFYLNSILHLVRLLLLNLSCFILFCLATFPSYF